MRFHYLVRGVVFVDGKVLLAHRKGAGHTFLPGGHIDNGEKAEAAFREFKEETGKKGAIKRFVDAIELQCLLGYVTAGIGRTSAPSSR